MRGLEKNEEIGDDGGSVGGAGKEKRVSDVHDRHFVPSRATRVNLFSYVNFFFSFF